MANLVNMSSIELIQKVHSALEQWVSALGPINNWPRIFCEKYDEACIDTTAQTTQDTIDIFLGQVGEHVRIGKDIIAGLEMHGIDSPLVSGC